MGYLALFSMLLPCYLCATFLAIPVYLQSTISQTAFLALNKKFMNNQRKNQQIMANVSRALHSIPK